MAFEIVGEIDARRLEAALNWVVRRHSILSTVVDDEGGGLWHVTSDFPEIRLHTETVRGSVDDRLDAATAFAFGPFDLRRELPMRAALYSSGRADYLFTLCIHHLVADGWSMDLIVEELAAAYAGALAPAAGGVRQFADFVAAEEKAEARARVAAGRNYWLSRLASAPLFLDLPTPHGRPAVKRFAGRSFSAALPTAVQDDLRRFCFAGRHTPSSVLVACYAALLHRRTGSPDFLIGLPMPGRVAEGSEDCIGFFANLVPLRVETAPDRSFRALLDQTWLATLEAMDWQDYPFISIIHDLKPVRSLSHTPVVQHIFNYVRPTSRLRIKGAAVRRVDLETPYAKYDLALQFVDDGAQIESLLVYDAELFDEDFARGFHRDFLAVLEGAIAAPHASLRALYLPLAGD